MHVHELICLWYTPFYTRPVKVILIRNPGTSAGFDVAHRLHRPDVPASELLARYDSRWTIETCNQEAKAHGVGQARNRVQQARSSGPSRSASSHRRSRSPGISSTVTPTPTSRPAAAPPPGTATRQPSATADMLAALRRELIRHEFWAQAPPMTTNPKLTLRPVTVNSTQPPEIPKVEVRASQRDPGQRLQVVG